VCVCVCRPECQQLVGGQQVSGVCMSVVSAMGENRVRACCVGLSVSMCRHY